jgi:hypothetical protein
MSVCSFLTEDGGAVSSKERLANEWKRPVLVLRLRQFVAKCSTREEMITAQEYSCKDTDLIYLSCD